MISLKTASLIVILCVHCSAVRVFFNGTQYIFYNLSSNPIAADTNYISFGFKTFQPSGLILYSSGMDGDFVKIELIHGTLRLMLNIDGNRTEMWLGSHLSDNKWHNVKMFREQRNLVVTLDTNTTTSTIAGGSVCLDRVIFVGGVGTEDSSVAFSPWFVGCLRNIRFESMRILYGSRNREVNYRTHGFLRYNCLPTNYAPITFPSPDGSGLLLTNGERRNFRVHLRFRTYHPDGVLVSTWTTKSRVILKLSSGMLCFSVVFRSVQPCITSIGQYLHDGMWHDVTIGVRGFEMWLILDGRRQNSSVGRRVGAFVDAVHVAYDGKEPGFVGCMYDISINEKEIDLQKLDNSLLEGLVVNQCGISSKCFPNPCLNGGRCMETYTEHRCDCLATYFTGPKCNLPLYQRTCENYRRLGVSQNTFCKVDPDGVGLMGAFEVLCNMSTPEPAATIIKHNNNNMKRQNVTSAAKKMHKHFLLNVTYPTSMGNIRALIRRSARCRQFVSFECFKSRLLNAPRGEPDVQWLSWQLKTQNYWGGAPGGSNKCACGVTGSCVNTTKYCNCDVGDDTWHEDSGYLSDKDSLPVRALRFSDTAEHSYFTLGPLECFGVARSDSKRVASPTFLSSACRPEERALVLSGDHVTATTTIDRVIRHNVTNGSKFTTVAFSMTPNTISPVTVHSSGMPILAIVLTSLVVAFALLIMGVIFVKRTRCWMCRKKRNIPDIQVRRHSIHSERFSGSVESNDRFSSYVEPDDRSSGSIGPKDTIASGPLQSDQVYMYMLERNFIPFKSKSNRI